MIVKSNVIKVTSKSGPLSPCGAQAVPLLVLLSFVLSLAPIRGAEPDIRRDAAVAAIEQVMPSVVNIATETVIEYHDWYDALLRDFYGWRSAPRQQRSISLGSGVII